MDGLQAGNGKRQLEVCGLFDLLSVHLAALEAVKKDRQALANYLAEKNDR